MSKMLPPNSAGFDQRQRAGSCRAHASWSIRMKMNPRKHVSARWQLTPLRRDDATTLFRLAVDTNGPTLPHLFLRIELDLVTKSTTGQPQDKDRALGRTALKFKDRLEVVGQLLANGQTDPIPATFGGMTRCKEPGLQFQRNARSFIMNLEVHSAVGWDDRKPDRPTPRRGLAGIPEGVLQHQ